MSSVERSLWLVLLLIGSSSSGFANPVNELASRMLIWRTLGSAPLCKDSTTNFEFPAKQEATQVATHDCDDGDATLFNALLCYSGENVGCDAVARAQVLKGGIPEAGMWKRSPRHVTNPNLRPKNSFSPDMALGVHLYASSQRTNAAVLNSYKNWINWIEANRPCIIDFFGACLRGLPRFCTDETESGCTLRPGDHAILRATLDRLGIPPPASTAPPDIPQSILDLLKINKDDLKRVNDLSLDKMSAPMAPYSIPILYIDSLLNKEGYSQHLVAVGILVTKQFPNVEGDFLLAEAAKNLANKQPKNAFFHWLAGGKKVDVAQRVLDACPATASDIPKNRTQWIWERSDNDSSEPKKSTMVWDCIFMGNLVAKMP